MHIVRKKNKDTTTLVFEGELTIYSVAQAKDELFADYESLTDKVVLDLQAIAEIDTAGVQLLLFAKKFLKGIHKNLFIMKSNEVVDSVLAVLDVTAQFAQEN